MISIPYQLKKPCSFPGCPKLVDSGNSYCDKHNAKVSSNRNKIYDDKIREPKYIKFYNSTIWKKLRNLKLSKDSLCEYCLEKEMIRIATEVDHVIPIKMDWSKRLDINNLKSACHRCHMIKTGEDKKKYGS